MMHVPARRRGALHERDGSHSLLVDSARSTPVYNLRHAEGLSFKRRDDCLVGVRGSKGKVPPSHVVYDSSNHCNQLR